MASCRPGFALPTLAGASRRQAASPAQARCLVACLAHWLRCAPGSSIWRAALRRGGRSARNVRTLCEPSRRLSSSLSLLSATAQISTRSDRHHTLVSASKLTETALACIGADVQGCRMAVATCRVPGSALLAPGTTLTVTAERKACQAAVLRRCSRRIGAVCCPAQHGTALPAAAVVCGGERASHFGWRSWLSAARRAR